MAIKKVVNRDRWGRIRGAVSPVDIPTRVCYLKDFGRWFQGSAFLFQIKFKFERFYASEKLELVEDVVNIEAKCKSSGKGKEKLSLTSCVIAQVMTATSIEHSNFSNVFKNFSNSNFSNRH